MKNLVLMRLLIILSRLAKSFFSPLIEQLKKEGLVALERHFRHIFEIEGGQAEFECEHCDLLYRRVLEPLGFEYNIDLSNCDNASCRLVLRKKKNLNFLL
ncbi:MAG: hypothetical protein A2Y12_17605 [Planctomycetes bacterium GWF2_42_9]|nr:MAG: hypothetical protein A2Y12_17605 [Planctomycetes bacterium GWF2_42_9]